MPTATESSGECLIYTFKEGLLSPIAHDLVIRVSAFRVEIGDDEATVSGVFDSSSLRVVDAAVDGVTRPGTLSAADKRKIERSIRRDVLSARRHPEIRFTSTSVGRSAGEGEVTDVAGELTMNGHTRPLRVTVGSDGDSWAAEATLHQPDWGIKPYRALLGTLRVQPTVRVRLVIPR